MQSIFSTQEKHSISQAIQAKKEAKENKAVQFANVSFSTTLKSFQNLIKNAAVAENLSKLYQKSTSQNDFEDLHSFSLYFNSLPQNKAVFEYDEKQIAHLKERVNNYNGTKADLGASEQFLLKIMQNLAAELDQLGFESLEFQALHEEYAEQFLTKNKLKNEIINEANAYLNEKNTTKADLLLESVESKLRAYYEVAKDSPLYNFFAPIMPYLNEKTQDSIIKALHTINEELKNPTAFELGGGNKLSWSVDEERIKFKILTQGELQYFYAQRQKAKAFKTLTQAFKQSENSKAHFTLDFASQLNLEDNLQGNLNSQSLLKGLLQEI